MRPVTRGAAPPGAKTYEEMRPTLVEERLGYYCSYCELKLDHSPHAEHIVPKGAFPAWRDRWDNLLVSCNHCNSHKSDERPKPADLDDYLWPTRDNTARAFTYTNVVPEVAHELTSELQCKAAKLRGLVKLSFPHDKRAKKRAEVFIQAQYFFSHMCSAPDHALLGLLRESIVKLAVSTGFFSIWMEVFASDPEMRRRFIDGFMGTAQDCFDPVTTTPVARPGGRL